MLTPQHPSAIMAKSWPGCDTLHKLLHLSNAQKSLLPATVVGGSCCSCELLPRVTSWGWPVLLSVWIGRAQRVLHPIFLLSAQQIIDLLKHS